MSDPEGIQDRIPQHHHPVPEIAEEEEITVPESKHNLFFQSFLRQTNDTSGLLLLLQNSLHRILFSSQEVQSQGKKPDLYHWEKLYFKSDHSRRLHISLRWIIFQLFITMITLGQGEIFPSKTVECPFPGTL